MVRRKIYISFVITTFFTLIFCAKSAFADHVDTCKSAASSKYGNLYTYQQDTFNYRCEHNMGGNGNYGTAVPTDTSYREWTRLPGENLEFSIARVVYSIGDNGYATGTDASGCIENNLSNATISGSSMELMTLKAGTKRTWIGTGTYHVGMSASAIKGGWSNLGGTATVSFSPDYISGSATVNSSGLVSTEFDITTHLFCYDTKNASNHIYYRFYKITRIKHGTPKATYSGTDYSESNTSESNPLVISDDNITFTHQLARNDGWSNPSSETLSDVYKRKITVGSTTVSEDSSWKAVTLKSGGTYESVTDSISASSLNLSPNVATKVCSTVTHRKVKGLHGHTASADSAANVDTSTVCLWVKDDRIMLEPGSRSYVHNSIDSKTVTHTEGSGTLSSMGGSRAVTQKFTFSFTHQLKLEGLTGYAYGIEYYVERSTNGGGSYSAVSGGGSSGSPLALNVNSGNNSYVSAMTNSWVSDEISRGGSTPTVCERITFRPKQVEIKMSSGVTTVKDSAWQSSTVCANVTRQKPKEAEISATCKVIVDGQENPTDTVFSTNERFQFQFGFNLTTDPAYSLSTTYTINRSINGGTATAAKTATVTAPVNAISDSPLISVEEGKSKKVCETINLNPFKYTIHLKGDGSDDGAPEAQTGSKDAATCCATVARPKREPRDDGEITVYSESSGALNNENQTGGFSQTQDAWLMRTDSADITYTHKLYRKAEKHTGDGTHQADVTSPAEDVTVRYRFADPATNFASTSIDTTHTKVIATNTENSPYSIKSVSSNARPTDNLLNANTVATAETVGEVNKYCQSISYVSEKYTLRGLYWQVDGQIYSGDPYLQGVDTPVSKEVVGKSAEGCVKVIRPWNFRITESTSDGDISKPIVALSTGNSVSFRLHADKNDSRYLITDIPNATVRFVAFVVEGDDALQTNYKGSVDTASDPCTHFSTQTGAACETLEERANQNLGPAGATGKKKYPDATYGRNGYYFYLKKNDITAPDLSTNQKYCIAVGVQPSNSDDGFNMSTNWAVSDATCFNIGKYPNFQAWGGSIFTEGGTKTSLTNVANKVFGSWADFAIIANKTVNKTASGATLISGQASNINNNCTQSPLTIANVNCASGNSQIPALGGASITVDTANLKQKFQERYLTDASKYTISSVIDNDVLRSGRSPLIIYNPNGGIYIKENVRVGSTNRSYGNAHLPQVIIYAKGDINIDQNVEHIDAWLIADGDVNTCVAGDQRTPALSATVCDKALNIAGPVVSRKIFFNRTAGADAHLQTLPNYAELVNLSAAVYVFAANEASGAQPVTTYLQKLPPRY